MSTHAFRCLGCGHTSDMTWSICPKCSHLVAPSTESILVEAARIVNGDRHASYGEPLDNHECTANLLTMWLRRRYGAAVPTLTAEDVCMFNILQKCAREANTPKRDNLVDIAGYAANLEKCGTERAARKEKP